MPLRSLLGAVIGNEARKQGSGSGLLGLGMGLVAARVATRSLPGAILVGGAMVAKKLYDAAQEKAALEQQGGVDDENMPAPEEIIIEGQSVPGSER